MAPVQQNEHTRVTRQKIAAMQQVPSLSLTSATEDALVSAASQTQHEDQIHINNEGALTASTEHEDQIHIGDEGALMDCTKVAIHISEGKRRPEAPMQATKFASEGGIILTNHIPICTHWTKLKESQSHITNYIGKVDGHFTMDTKSKAVKNACIDMLKGGQRQKRYRLKKEHFNGISANQVTTISPVKCMTNEKWGELVAMWSDPKHKADMEAIMAEPF